MKKKKKKKKQRRQKGAFTGVPVEELAGQAEVFLKQGREKKALEIYKNLYKNDSADRWRTSLVNAYQVRIDVLLSKGLLKEAQTIADILRKNFGVDDVPLQINLLLRTEKYLDAAGLYGEHHEALTEVGLSEAFDQFFAAAALTGAEEILQEIPDGSPAVSHYPHALQALESYCAGDDSRTRSALEKIPFRSPYRDLKLILKGLLSEKSDSERAGEALKKVPVASPFFKLASVSATALLPNHIFIQNIKEIKGIERKYLAGLNNLGTTRITMLQQLTRHADKPEALFRFCARELRRYNAEIAEELCLKLLPSNPYAIPAFEKVFKELPSLESYRLEALDFEKQGLFLEADYGWGQYLKLLKKQPASPDRELIRALVLRHMAEPAMTGSGQDKRIACKYLEESLSCDPADKDAWLKFLELKRWDYKKYHKYIDKALAVFPEEIDLLLLAAEEASRRSAFKKASGYVAALLKIDPINIKAHDILVNAHLSHARKLVRLKKYTLAGKEMETAGSHERQGRQSGEVHICRGLLAGITDDKENSAELFRQGEHLSGSELVGKAMAAIEAHVWKAPSALQKDLEARFKKLCKQSFHKEDLLRLIRYLGKKYSEQYHAVRHLLKLAGRDLGKAAGDDYSREELCSICSFFHRLENLPMLRQYAQAGLDRNPGNPLLTYFKYFAVLDGGEREPNSREQRQLEKAHEAAMKQKDIMTAEKIGALIHPWGLGGSFNPFYDFNDLDLPPLPGGLGEMLEIMEKMTQGDKLAEPEPGPQLDPSKSFIDQDPEVVAQVIGGNQKKKKRTSKNDEGGQLSLL